MRNRIELDILNSDPMPSTMPSFQTRIQVRTPGLRRLGERGERGGPGPERRGEPRPGRGRRVELRVARGLGAVADVARVVRERVRELVGRRRRLGELREERGARPGAVDRREGEGRRREAERVEPRARVEAPRGDRVERAPAWTSTGEPERPDQTLKCSRSVTSTSIRLILGRIDGAHRVPEVRRKGSCHIVRLRSH